MYLFMFLGGFMDLRGKIGMKMRNDNSKLLRIHGWAMKKKKRQL